MPYLSARMLDWGNDLLIHLRLRGRQPVPDLDAARRYAERLPEPLHPDPVGLAPLVPSRGRAGGTDRSSVSRWRSPSPWPGAEGPNALWWATRVRARIPEPVGAVVLLHGWMVSRGQLGVYHVHARRLAARGVDVWLPRLPYHMERTPPGFWSGERCLSADLVASADAIRQAVAETRSLAAWLRGQGMPVALWGTSFGGWVAGIVATLESDWRAISLWAPVADPSAVLWGARVARDLRAALRAAGIGPDQEAFALDELAPGTAPLRVERGRLQIVSGAHDRIIHADSVARLARRWGVGVRWMAHGHISLMISPAAGAVTRAFLVDRLSNRS